jgi:hypothetical protein
MNFNSIRSTITDITSRLSTDFFYLTNHT